MKMTIAQKHLSIDISGFLHLYRRKSMRGLMTDNGRELSDAEVRAVLNEHLAKGHKVIPFCDEKDCPDFDYFGKGCPGHDVHYFDDNNNEITREEYEKRNKLRGKEVQHEQSKH